MMHEEIGPTWKLAWADVEFEKPGCDAEDSCADVEFEKPGCDAKDSWSS